MTLKELSQLYYLNREIEIDKQRLARLRAEMPEARAAKLDGMPISSGNGSGSAIERHIAEIVDLEFIISAKITQCIHERARLERYIAEIPDSLTRQIFTLRFINGLPWAQVAYSIGGNTEDSVKKICYRYLNGDLD